MATIAEEITNILSRLPADKQQRALDFVRSLDQSVPAPVSTLPPGTPIRDLLQFRPTLPREGTEEIKRIIEEDCETIELDEH